MVDIHHHLLWGLDDGSKDIETSIAMAKASAEDGVTHIVCTPHANGTYDYKPEVNAEKATELRERLETEDRIAFRYATPKGEITAEANPNGSLSNIAGILNEGRNVLGMMPHPDRSSETLLGSADGLKLFRSVAESLATA